MHKSDRNRLAKRLTALVLGHTDMQHARAAVDALENERTDVDLMRALETAVAVSYARAFSQSSLLRLNSDDYRPADRELADPHGELLNPQNKVYAHTDKDSGRSTSVEVTKTSV